MRAVLDVNVIVSALLSQTGAPARLLQEWERGEFELVVSPALLEELQRTLAYPKLRRLIPPTDAELVLAWLRAAAELVDDPEGAPPERSEDPDDDYLIALAAQERVALVTGDKHLLALADRIPVLTPAAFLSSLSGS